MKARQWINYFNRQRLVVGIGMALSISVVFGNPYEDQIEKLSTPNRLAIQNLGWMRAYGSVQLEWLKDKDPQVRLAAASVLGICGSVSDLPALRAALEDESVFVQQSAAYSIEAIIGKKTGFDAFITKAEQQKQLTLIDKMLADVAAGKTSFDAITDVKSPWIDRETATRAAGASNAPDKVRPLLIKALELYHTKTKSRWDNQEFVFVQAVIRALGRLPVEPTSHDSLAKLLTIKEWSAYAAEALGESGDPKAVPLLLATLPKTMRGILRGPRLYDSHLHSRLSGAPSVDKPGLMAHDFIPRNQYAIMLALSQLEEHFTQTSIEQLRNLIPQIVSNTPVQYDGLIVYQREPWQLIYTALAERCGMRTQIAEAVFEALGQPANPTERNDLYKTLVQVASINANTTISQYPAVAGSLLEAYCIEINNRERIEALLNHPSKWVRISAAKALMEIGSPFSIPALRAAYEAMPEDLSYGLGYTFIYRIAPGVVLAEDEKKGYQRTEGYSTLNVPLPNPKEFILCALGKIAPDQSLSILAHTILNPNESNDTQVAATKALMMNPSEAATRVMLDCLAKTPIMAVRLYLREALWQRGITLPEQITSEPGVPLPQPEGASYIVDPRKVPLVFIKGDITPDQYYQITPNRQAQSTTDAGPSYRNGRKICRLDPDGTVTDLTHFKSGFVTNLEVSYDAKRIIFSHCTEKDPWWHIYEMNADGSNLRQLTKGNFHDVHPNYLSDGRIVFTSTRTGMYDEYHGYAATGLTVMDPDGSNINVVGLNFGGDSDPVVFQNGRVYFVRLEVMYSRLKTELNLLSVFPDGTQALTHYGPESREFWMKGFKINSASAPRHRILAFTQPQQFPDGRIVMNSFRGPFIIGPGKQQQRLLQKNNDYAVTSPYPVDNNTLLVSAGKRPANKYYAVANLGIHTMDITTGELTLLYDDPKTSEFEIRPLAPRPVPPVALGQGVKLESYTARIDCQNVGFTRNPFVKERARYVAILEGLPVTTRYQSHTEGGVAWRNHGGSIARVLGVIPIASDGSFSAEVPADRLLHIQALDSEWKVLDDQLSWMQLRPGENRGCMGCHEPYDVSPPVRHNYLYAALHPAQRCVPDGPTFEFRGKMWYKGTVRRNDWERLRSVNSTTFIGR